MGDFHVNIEFVVILLFAGNLLCASLILIYWGWNTKSKPVQLILLAKFLLPCAWLIRVFQFPVSEKFIVVISNVMLFIATALEMSAVLQVNKNDSVAFRKHYKKILLTCIIIYTFIGLVVSDQQLRIALISLLYVVLMGYPLGQLFRDHNHSKLQRFIAYIYSLILCSILLRGLFALLIKLHVAVPYLDSHNGWLLIQIYLFMFAGSMAFLLLGKESHDKALLKAATYDGLTDVLNRSTFISQANEVIQTCFVKQVPVAFMVIDIDDFKRINDCFGHYVGDAVLKDFAVQLKACLRKSDLAGRFGGEEFAILIPEIDESVTRLKAEQLRTLIEYSSFDECSDIHYTISIGYCNVIPDENTSIDYLYRICDDALYQAKSEGKNCCQSAVSV